MLSDFRPEHWIALGSLAVAALTLIATFVREIAARRHEGRTRFHRERLQYVSEFLARTTFMAVKAEDVKGKLSEDDVRDLAAGYQRIALVGSREMGEAARAVLECVEEIYKFEVEAPEDETKFPPPAITRPARRRRLNERRVDLEADLVTATRAQIEPHPRHQPEPNASAARGSGWPHATRINVSSGITLLGVAMTFAGVWLRTAEPESWITGIVAREYVAATAALERLGHGHVARGEYGFAELSDLIRRQGTDLPGDIAGLWRMGESREVPGAAVTWAISPDYSDLGFWLVDPYGTARTLLFEPAVLSWSWIIGVLGAVAALAGVGVAILFAIADANAKP